jgi:hypothetical protein
MIIQLVGSFAIMFVALSRQAVPVKFKGKYVTV